MPFRFCWAHRKLKNTVANTLVASGSAIGATFSGQPCGHAWYQWKFEPTFAKPDGTPLDSIQSVLIDTIYMSGVR